MAATAPKIVGASQTREPVYVFGSDLSGDLTQHTAVNAVRLHRADPATLSGGSGNAGQRGQNGEKGDPERRHWMKLHRGGPQKATQS